MPVCWRGLWFVPTHPWPATRVPGWGFAERLSAPCSCAALPSSSRLPHQTARCTLNFSDVHPDTVGLLTHTLPSWLPRAPRPTCLQCTILVEVSGGPEDLHFSTTCSHIGQALGRGACGGGTRHKADCGAVVERAAAPGEPEGGSDAHSLTKLLEWYSSPEGRQRLGRPRDWWAVWL